MNKHVAAWEGDIGGGPMGNPVLRMGVGERGGGDGAI